MDHLTMYAGTFFSGAFSMAMLIRELESLDTWSQQEVSALLAVHRPNPKSLHPKL